MVLLATGPASQARAEPVARSGSVAGAVIARKSGEEVRFIDVSNWRFVDLKQDLLSGDILRTNATGQLAILFSDRTQIRMGRNATLVVKQITAGTSADTVLRLQSGTIWARAERGGPGVRVETPAAAAAIRGTDWTMTVEGAKTSLNVLEGIVELSNPQGSVAVSQGEGAVASIGQAPRKVVIVDSDDREQMLFYLPPREAFSRMPASGRPVSVMRREADRIIATPPQRRSTEEWVSLAEAQLTLEGRRKTRETLALVKDRRLTASQQARVTLVEAILLATDKQYAEAAKLFERAQMGLDKQRKGIALYGGYYARSLADPNRVEALPRSVGGPEAAFLRAYAVGFLQDLSAAMKELQEAERQYPDDPQLPAYRAALALLLNDRAQYQEAVERALSLDPNEPLALETRALYKAGFQGDNNGAMADLEAAVRVTPGNSTTWNTIGNVQSSRDANREGEAAFKKAIELDPLDPVAHANLAIFYLDTGRIEKAKQEIDKAIEADPAFDLALVARGRYYLQIGEVDKAIKDLLAGTVANPAYSQGQVMLAAAYYEKGDRVAAGQALDNADRLDDNDPVISSFRTAVAIDEYDAEGAMKYAREFLERSRARGGDYSSLGASQDAGSTLNEAFRLQGLNAWGQFYGDVAFDPFSGTGYLDQTTRGSVNPLANSFNFGGDIINNTANSSTFSSLIQGLLLEPHMIAGRSRSAGIIQRPFFEGSIGGGVTVTEENTGWIGNGELQFYSNEPFPVSGYFNAEWDSLNDTTRAWSDGNATFDLDNDVELLNGTAYLTASPTAYDRVVAYVSHSDRNDDLLIPTPPALIPLLPETIPYSLDTKFTTAGLGWSHTVAYRNVVNAALLYTSVDSDINDYLTNLPLLVSSRTTTKQNNYVAAVNHAYGVDAFTWRYGIEGGWIDTESERQDYFVGFPIDSSSAESVTGYGRVYVDLLHEITPDLKAEYALHGVLLQGGGIDLNRVEPRAGIAWAPAEGHWLRAGYMRQGTDFSTPTLSPIGLLGMQPNAFGVGIDGYTDTIALRWDAEWNDRLFTAVDYQHQIIRDISVPDIVSQSSFDYGKATVDRVAFTANLVLGHGFGLAGTYAFANSSHDLSAAGLGENLPFLPEHSGQLALTWVSQANIKTTVAANYIGKRQGDGTADTLDDFWTLDAYLTWEPFDKRFELEAAAYNLLGEDFEVASNTNGWGRVFKGTLKVRF
jgi:tetratricopeptide (TPR) repeat protein